MHQRSKNRFPLKIALSYFLLFALALVSGYFIYSEIQVYITKDPTEETNIKLLKTGALATELYEAESLSKLALQSKTKQNFRKYQEKVDSIFTEIDTLKQLSVSDYQRSLLDSVQYLLHKKMANSSELLNLKVKNDANNSIDNALKGFSEMEASLGKITAEGLAPNINDLSPKAQKVIRDLADYLNKNIPKDTTIQPDGKKIDSILNASKTLLADAKKSDQKVQQSLTTKEKQINQNDLELSQQLRTILSAFEQEIIVNTYNDNIKRQSAMRRGMRLAGIAALLGFITVAVFTFLINRDYWKIQTYREKLEKEKKYSESLLKSREQLISTVSHDLKTPLNTITGYTELMENTAITEKQAGYLRNVRSASGYVENLVNDLLDFSKLEAGKLNIEKKSFVVADLIRETVENVESLYHKKQLRLFLEIDPQLQKNVLGDPFRIRQILTNLLSNAFKFTEEGSITLKANAINETGKKLAVRIDVIDTGIGIPKEKQHLIFKEFTQADTFTEKKYGGHGLGLAISKKLAELLKGSLLLKSRVGQGSTFTLQIPLEITHTATVPEPTPSHSAPKLKMLIIDDDAALLGMLKELTESMGIQVRAFANFMEIAEDSHLDYDLVLTDIQMPQVSGFEVLKELKSGNYPHYKNQPIVAMTGRRDLDFESYMAHGFAQVLQKPFSKGELIDILNILGIKTDKMEKKSISHSKNPESHLYDLDIIHSFLGDDDSAVYEVLATFVKDTHTNMELLTAAVAQLNYEKINLVAHRMLPMFRQLKVNSTVPDLERLETVLPSDMDRGQLQHSFQNIRKGVADLIRELSERLATSPDYSG